MSKKVSVIISNRNDVAMLAVTVRSCIEEFVPLGKGCGEVVICDNSDAHAFEMVKSAIPHGYIRDGTVKIIRQNFPCLFTARETAIRNSSAPYISCLDSHMIVGHNMFLDLYDFMERHKDDETLGFAHAPISWAHQHGRAAKHDRDMSENELGPWGTAYSDERPITWKGMPWMCRKDFFLNREGGIGGYGALSQHKLSWGGGDMLIGIKPWMLGFKNWAVPCRPGIHIGPFPKTDTPSNNPNIVSTGKTEFPDGYKYRLYRESGIGPHTFGFLVACYVLGGEPMMERNKETIRSKFGKFLNIEREWENAKKLGAAEKQWLDSAKKMSFEELLKAKPWACESFDCV